MSITLANLLFHLSSVSLCLLCLCLAACLYISVCLSISFVSLPSLFFSYSDGPGAHFVCARGEVVNEIECVIARLDDLADGTNGTL